MRSRPAIPLLATLLLCVAPPAAAAETDVSPSDSEVRAAVRSYIERRAVFGGMKLEDPTLGGTWSLRLSRLSETHRLQEQYWMTRGYFRGVFAAHWDYPEESERDVALEFVFRETGEGLEVLGAEVHAVDTIERPRVYVCSVHPDVRAEREGACPVCGDPFHDHRP